MFIFFANLTYTIIDINIALADKKEQSMQDILNSILPFITTTIASVLVFGSVIFIHELGHFIAAKKSGITVYEFALGMGPTIFKIEKNSTVYALRLFPIGGFVSMEGEDEESDKEGSFTKAPLPNRILVVVAGAVMNLILGFLVLIIVVNMNSVVISRTIAEFDEGASTQASGLQVDDTILSVNGRRCFTANDLIYEFARTQEGAADLTVERNGQTIELENVVFETYVDDNGINQLVLDFKVYGEPKTFFNVIEGAFNWGVSLVRMVFVSLTDLITGRIAVNNLSGPVGIVTAIGEASGMGLENLLLLTALISINLGVFNLLPVPALDGGRLMFLILEAIRRKPIPQKFEIAVNMVGFMLLIGLMLFTTFNDITRLID